MISNIKRLYFKYEEIVNYLIFGFLTTIISLIIYYGLTITIINPNIPIELQIANIISWLAGVIFAYITNRKFVFKSKNNNKFQEFLTFTGARISTLFLDIKV